MGDMSGILKKADEYGIRLSVLPASCLAEIKTDIQQVASENELNGFQQYILHKRYVLDLPQADFEIRSIVLAVWPLNLAHATFTHEGLTVHDIFDDGYADADRHKNGNITAIFESAGFHLHDPGWLPLKRLAVRAGLTEYGRNNITYAKEWGSFIMLAGYFSDIEPSEYVWREVKNAEICDSCGKCIHNCPTGAILPDRFLIDNEKCLADINPRSGDAFPDWVPKYAHHRLIECIKCEDICPMNKTRLENIKEHIDFSEEETNIILTYPDAKSYPKSLTDKLWYFGSDLQKRPFKRNLKAMFENAELDKQTV